MQPFVLKTEVNILAIPAYLAKPWHCSIGFSLSEENTKISVGRYYWTSLRTSSVDHNEVRIYGCDDIL